MMKQILGGALLLLALHSSAQRIKNDTDKNYPEGSTRIGLVVSDLFLGRFRAEFENRFSGPNAIDLGLGLIMNSIYSETNGNAPQNNRYTGYYVNTGYKHYFFGHNKAFTFTRISLSYQYVPVGYQTGAFVPYIENGITYYSYEQVNRNYHIHTLGANAEAGLELYFNPFFMEFTFGLNYRSQVGKDPTPQEFDKNNYPWEVDYEGPSPMLSYRLGFYLD